MILPVNGDLVPKDPQDHDSCEFPLGDFGGRRLGFGVQLGMTP